MKTSREPGEKLYTIRMHHEYDRICWRAKYRCNALAFNFNSTVYMTLTFLPSASHAFSDANRHFKRCFLRLFLVFQLALNSLGWEQKLRNFTVGHLAWFSPYDEVIQDSDRCRSWNVSVWSDCLIAYFHPPRPVRMRIAMLRSSEQYQGLLYRKNPSFHTEAAILNLAPHITRQNLNKCNLYIIS
jgi:hypothetical protein